ncbi:MAG: hypothetical protein HUN04_12085 [Desulfobacter sp.]|nr:MAG: hypothetical protein HUN04_12085 [Desulfobacter sp.]
MKEDLSRFTGKEVVVDTRSNWVYLGILDRVTESSLVLTDADAHDITDTEVSKERYIYDSRTGGIKANRDRVHISLDYIVGFSALGDIKAF